MTINRYAIFSLSILLTQTLAAAPLERSVSPSQQFIIYGADTSFRGAISKLAEQTKANLLVLLRQPDNWKTPIIINLQSPQANLPEIPPSALHFSQTGFGLKLQLDLIIPQNLDGSLVERELLRAILLEMIYRRQTDIAAGTAYVEPPDWLLDGILALAPGRTRQPLIEALALSNKITPLEELLRQRPALLDSPARLIYRACSYALVQLLVNRTDGGKQLARYIDNLSHASNDPLADLKLQFPVLNGDVKEIWRSSVAQLGAGQKYHLLTFAETERKLGELLRIKISDAGVSGKPVALEDLCQRKISKGEGAALNQLKLDLLLLSGRAHPIMRPIVQEYQQIATLLAGGKRHRLAQRLARLKTTESKITARMSDIEDYMNWFEATQSKTQSGVFANYLNAVDEQNEGRTRRRDAISVYLDALEEQF
jgi:hypothetical protein